MRSSIRRGLFAGAALLALALVASQHLGSAQAYDQPAAARGLVLGSADDAQPENIEQFLTGVTRGRRRILDSGL